MTAQEVAEYFGVCVGYVTSGFEKFQKSMIKKHGIRVIKITDPQGKKCYFLERADPSRIDLPIGERPVSIIAEPPSKKIFIETDWLGLDEFSFMLLVALFCMPRSQFKGTVMSFMRYAGVKGAKDKATLAKSSFIELSLQRVVALSYMDGDEILVKAIPPKIQKEGRYISFTVAEVIKCVQLSLKYDLKSWSNCLKVWLSVKILEDNCSVLNIADIANMSLKEIPKYLGVLSFLTEKKSS